jgi:hypothetical protein
MTKQLSLVGILVIAVAAFLFSQSWDPVTGRGTGRGYALEISSAALSAPADSTTYYCGASFGFSCTATPALVRLYIPQAGTITKAYMTVRTYSAAGTNEQWTMNIRLNNTSDTVISATVDSSGGTTPVSNTALSIAVVAGDYVEIKIVTPIWATNPGYLYINGVLWIT